jgi:hypothetical protein
MSGESGRHEAVAGELAEWVGGPVRGDWFAGRAASGAASVGVLGCPEPVPGVVEDLDAPVTLLVSIDGNLPPGRAVQAEALREALLTAAMRSRVAECAPSQSVTLTTTIASLSGSAGGLSAGRARDVLRQHLSCLVAEPAEQPAGRVAIHIAKPSGSCSQNSSPGTRASSPSATAWPCGPMAGSDRRLRWR